MVGAKHISSPHDYIYDTKEASLNNVGEFDAAVATSGDTSYSNSISGATNIVSSTSSSSSGSSGGGSSGGRSVDQRAMEGPSAAAAAASLQRRGDLSQGRRCPPHSQLASHRRA